MGKLEDMRVERVDGVDRPATGHRWVIVKDENGGEAVEKDYAGAARTALEALAKEEGVSVSEETAEALTALAKLLELSVEFKSVDGEAAAADEDTEVEKDETTEETPDIKQLVKDALAEVLAEELGEVADEQPVAKAAESKQPAEQDDVEQGAPMRKSAGGRVSTANVIFGQ